MCQISVWRWGIFLSELTFDSIKIFSFFFEKVTIMKLKKFLEIFIVYSLEDEKNVAIILGLF